MAVGYYTEADQKEPVFEPGTDVDCPVCVKPLDHPATPIKTISAMPASTRALSAYFRVHKACWVELEEEERGAWIATACKVAEQAAAEEDSVFAMGQAVATYDERDNYICDGVIEGIHHPAEPDGEEFYDVRTDLYGIERLSEMRLTDV